MRGQLLFLALGLPLALAGCNRGTGDEGPAATPVVLAPVEVRDLEERIEATGELLSPAQARVAAEVPGRITEILRDEGERVEAGTVVLTIDPERRELELEDARARVAEAAAALKDRERETGRVRTLFRKSVASRSQLDQAETELQLAKARLDGARAHLGVAERALRDANVRAPFAGLVSERDVQVGEFVQAGSPLFELVALDPIEVEFHLAERDSGRVSVGNRVRLTVAPYPDERFEARVELVSPKIDPRTRTLRVKAELPNPEDRLRPGLFARVDLGIAVRQGVLMVPEEAVLYRADGAIVFRLVEGDVAERRVVETGAHHGGAVEVVRGLEARDVVVRRGHTELVDGSRVAVRNADGTPVTPQVAEGREEAGDGS